MRELDPQRLDAFPMITWKERFKSRILLKLFFIMPKFLLNTRHLAGSWGIAELNNSVTLWETHGLMGGGGQIPVGRLENCVEVQGEVS